MPPIRRPFVLAASTLALSATVVLAAPPSWSQGQGAAIRAVAQAVDYVTGRAHGQAVSAAARQHGKLVSAQARAKSAAKAAGAKVHGGKGGRGADDPTEAPAEGPAAAPAEPSTEPSADAGATSPPDPSPTADHPGKGPGRGGQPSEPGRLKGSHGGPVQSPAP